MDLLPLGRSALPSAVAYWRKLLVEPPDVVGADLREVAERILEAESIERTG